MSSLSPPLHAENQQRPASRNFVMQRFMWCSFQTVRPPTPRHPLSPESAQLGFLVGELDLAAVVSALAAQPELGARQHTTAALDGHAVFLVGLEVGFGHLDTRCEDAAALLAHVLFIASHIALLTRANLPELDSDLV